MLALLLQEGGVRNLGHLKESSFILKNKTGSQSGRHSQCEIMILNCGSTVVWALFFLSCLRPIWQPPSLGERRALMVPLFVKAKLCFLKPQTWEAAERTRWMIDKLEEASDGSASSLNS